MKVKIDIDYDKFGAPVGVVAVGTMRSDAATSFWSTPGGIVTHTMLLELMPAGTVFRDTIDVTPSVLVRDMRRYVPSIADTGWRHPDGV